MTSNYWYNIWHLYIFNLYSIVLQTITRMTLIVDVRVSCLEIILRRQVASIICNDNLDFYRTKKKCSNFTLQTSIHYWILITHRIIILGLILLLLFFAKYLQTTSFNYVYIWHFNTEHWSLSITFYWPRNDIIIGILDIVLDFMMIDSLR